MALTHDPLKPCPYILFVSNRVRNSLVGRYAQSNICTISVTSKKLPNVYKSCPKLISIEKLKILTPLQKLFKNIGDLCKLIVAKGFEKLPKVQ